MTTPTIPTRPVVDDTLHLIAETLQQHRTSTAYFARDRAYGWFCCCLTDGPRTFRNHGEADDAAAVHQAEAVAESLRLGEVWLGDGAEPALPPLGKVA